MPKKCVFVKKTRENADKTVSDRPNFKKSLYLASGKNTRTMKKEKIHIEYLLNASSRSILWNAISTPIGMEDWFADKVQMKDKTFIFTWGKSEVREAEMIATRMHSFVRFHWKDDEDEKSYFEFKINYNELTGDYVLEITDFVDPEERNDQSELWGSQIDTLKRACGM